jgi:hypothetical protein
MGMASDGGVARARCQWQRAMTKSRHRGLLGEACALRKGRVPRKGCAPGERRTPGRGACRGKDARRGRHARRGRRAG